MAEQRQRYSAAIRQRAFEMSVYEGFTFEAIMQELSVNEFTLRNWRREDRWQEAKNEGTNASFANIRNNLLLVIHRLSQRLVESMIGADPQALPDENVELRLDRLTRSLERTAPMGTFLMMKQRLDVVAEIQQAAVQALEETTVTEEEIRHAFKVLKIYTGNIKTNQRKGTPFAA